jgi:DNA repair protein RecO (recombination protein O)
MARAFLLHSRAYRETSVIASFVTDSDGRVDVLMRAVRSSRKGKSLQPVAFCGYDIAWQGKSELKQLAHCESLGPSILLEGRKLYCGFYINELLYRLAPSHEPDSRFYLLYHTVLQHLSVAATVEPVLRDFELGLLDVMGYGLCLDRDVEGAALKEYGAYTYVLERGLVSGASPLGYAVLVGRGMDFLAIAQRDFSDVETARLAKRLLRSVLSLYLGGRPLRSRELFSHVK